MDVVQASKEATQDQVTYFIVQHLKEYSDKLLPDQFKANKVADESDLFAVNKRCEAIKEQHKALLAKIT